MQIPYVDDEDAKLGFVDVLLGLMKIKNVELYVTGSNSRMLSSDILTEFKDRGDDKRSIPCRIGSFTVHTRATRDTPGTIIILTAECR